MTVLKRIGASLLGLLLLAYIVYHALVVPYTSIKTETAVSFSAKKTISVTESYIIRNEHLVASEHQGVFSYTVANGSKVANGGAIASVYGSHEAAQAKVKLDDLDRQIEALENLLFLYCFNTVYVFLLVRLILITSNLFHKFSA